MNLIWEEIPFSKVLPSSLGTAQDLQICGLFLHIGLGQSAVEFAPDQKQFLPLSYVQGPKIFHPADPRYTVQCSYSSHV